MASIVWPAGLPQKFLQRGYSEAAPDNLIVDQFETGPAGRRPRSSAAPYQVSGVMMMTIAQWEALLDFCEATLFQRSLAFGFPAHGVSEAAEWLVRFTAAPARSPATPEVFEVSLQLEVLP